MNLYLSHSHVFFYTVDTYPHHSDSYEKYTLSSSMLCMHATLLQVILQPGCEGLWDALFRITGIATRPVVKIELE